MLKSENTGDLIAASLRLDISVGKIRPGDALRQEELADRFAVSRIPIREALRTLERDGLVEVFPNRGAFVIQLTTAELNEITDLRVLIEGDLILRAVPLLTRSDLSEIQMAAYEAKRQSTTSSWIVADLAFHEALYRPAKRARQLELFRSLRRSVQQYEAGYRRLPEQRKAWLEDHSCLVSACSKRDVEHAHRILTGHIRRAGAFLVGCVEKIQVRKNTGELHT
ncbi:DNA-binding GntR family transcriptional regulator [Granulicella aggregans]|uniref:DNA-binding GntR family transcriptional regulator n=1 Tax=Granulicella aggregans TaxID=474949 RepID=A0A7W7ZII0_9BACT|nr:DNA-binding GntR family transcriptional regulator [Granulicella aggregans]